MINELNRQSEMYKTQPPKVVFKQSSKFSQFIAPLLAGNSKTWLLTNISTFFKDDTKIADLLTCSSKYFFIHCNFF